jgi:type VI secretion system secreted protein Hcp
MALNAYLRLTGTTQGQILGPVTLAGKEDTIEVLQAQHLVHRPLDAVTGQPTSNKKHKPVKITKRVDQTSPLLFNMWITNEIITSCQLDFYQPGSQGQEVLFYTIELENAVIASIRLEQPNTLDPALSTYPITEELTFVYGKITTTHQPSGNTVMEDLSD